MILVFAYCYDFPNGPILQELWQRFQGYILPRLLQGEEFGSHSIV
jgi:hypothetical protein